MRKINLICLVVLSAFLFGCAAPYIQAQNKYFKGDPVGAEEVLTPLVEKEVEKTGRNQNLYLWDLGVYRFFQADYGGATGVRV